ncbi:hypothetical protein AX16_008706 [Volvariella volvacea WC 439]|nr:hypothetical protein AX16_008706 [Volvariella volvacea WC 439]
MFLAGVFLAILAHSLASPVPVSVPGGPIPSPLCVATALLSTSRCDAYKTRTIFDILYSCLGVIFLCTYISVHHNIPDQNDPWANKLWFKVRTMLYALLAPELVIMWALRQRIMAERLAERHKEQGWTRTHGFFLQMGGLMLKVDNGKYEVVRWRHGRLGASPGMIVDKLPAIRKKEIEDHGKGDILAKAIVVIQTSWFVVQCITRRVAGLALTELELVTLAFAALNVVTYILWWDKPLNVDYPIYIDKEGNRIDGPEEVQEEGWCKKLQDLMKSILMRKDQNKEKIGFWRGLWRYVRENGEVKLIWQHAISIPFSVVFGPLLEMTNEEGDGEGTTSVHPFYAARLDWEQHQFAYLCASIVGIIFGGIHLIGWNFPFLTATELWLWRASSLILTVIPAMVTISWRSLADPQNTAFDTNTIDQLFRFLVTRIGAPLYITARIVILVLAFFALRDLPDSAYENIVWTNFIPHI